MVRAAVIGVLAVLLVAATGCARGRSYVRAGYDFGQVERVAVVDVEGAVRGEAAKNQLADFFVIELLLKGYTPVERRQVKAVLAEQDFQLSAATTSEGALEAGRILNVDALIVANIPAYGEEMSMTAKMIDAEDGSILWAGAGSGARGRMLATIAGAVVGGGVGVIAGGDTAGRVVGGVAGAVLGGVAGQALTPQQATLARKVVGKVCDDLPRSR